MVTKSNVNLAQRVITAECSSVFIRHNSNRNLAVHLNIEIGNESRPIQIQIHRHHQVGAKPEHLPWHWYIPTPIASIGYANY